MENDCRCKCGLCFREIHCYNPACRSSSDTPTVDSSVDWEEEFEDKWESWMWGKGDTSTKGFIKSFIRTNRQSLITRIRGEVEEVKSKTFNANAYSALLDVLNRIDKIV